MFVKENPHRKKKTTSICLYVKNHLKSFTMFVKVFERPQINVLAFFHLQCCSGHVKMFICNGVDLTVNISFHLLVTFLQKFIAKNWVKAM